MRCSNGTPIVYTITPTDGAPIALTGRLTLDGHRLVGLTAESAGQSWGLSAEEALFLLLRTVEKGGAISAGTPKVPGASADN